MENSIYCPYCYKYTYLTNRGGWSNGQTQYWMGECNSCHRVVLGVEEPEEHTMYPLPLPKPVDERIPEPIRKDFEEALKCFSIEAYRAAGVMARRAMQSCCLDKGASEDKKLNNQIEWLFTERIITKELKDWANEVRLTGNDAAHPKKPAEDKSVTREDTKEILDLLEQFTNVLYVAPAIAEERRKSRTQDKSQKV
ncbi:MAG: DUF4145 domain-containing protein [Candidatus Stahlbacteria bacterium]|nr:DUF4145 domain-containing protein [Candidatus Stahlbacteria bacterium]